MKTLFKRLHGSAVVWSWVFNALRLASGLIVLPLILGKFTEADLGMYYVLLSLAALAPLVDFGLGASFPRFVGYAMAGAETLQSHGLPAHTGKSDPNYPLLWQLLLTIRRLYGYLTLLLLVVLGAWGTYLVELRVGQTSSVLMTRLAWAATLVATIYDIYSSWWSVYLRGLNQMREAARIGVVALSVKLVISVALLLSGFGLLSIPLAGFACSIIQRQMARARTLSLLKGEPPSHVSFRESLRILWPNSWRLGIQFISSYLTVNANMAICAHAFGLQANAVYGLSAQLMSITAGMSYVWLFTKWPVIIQYQGRREPMLVQRSLWSRLWLQNGTFILMSAAILWLVPTLLRLFGSHKTILPIPWMAALMLGGLLDLQFTTWSTLISTQNRLPFLWPAVATNVLSLILSLTLVHFTRLGLGALVLGPLISGSLFNYWHWPRVATRDMGTTFLRFLFLGPNQTQPHKAGEPLVNHQQR